MIELHADRMFALLLTHQRGEKVRGMTVPSFEHSRACTRLAYQWRAAAEALKAHGGEASDAEG